MPTEGRYGWASLSQTLRPACRPSVRAPKIALDNDGQCSSCGAARRRPGRASGAQVSQNWVPECTIDRCVFILKLEPAELIPRHDVYFNSISSWWRLYVPDR